MNPSQAACSFIFDLHTQEICIFAFFWQEEKFLGLWLSLTLSISYLFQQAQDDESRKAAQEAEKKALAEAQANKERKHRASLKAAQKSRKLEKLDKCIKQAKEAKMPSM